MIQIRPAQPDDANAIIHLVRQIIAEPASNLLLSEGEFNYTEDEEREILRQCSQSENSLYLVAEEGQTLTGMLHCTGGSRKATRHETTLSMSIAKAYRNQGLGSKLLEEAIAWAKANPRITRMDLVVFERNQAAMHLYSKFGFEVEGHHRHTIYRDGEYLDSISMALVW